MEKRTAAEIAWYCYQENQPMDYKYLNHLKRKLSSEKERVNWAKEVVEPFCDASVSKKKLTLAAKELIALIGW